MERRPNSYRFRDCNRAKSASHMRFMRTGESLLPGIYESKGFVDDNMKKPSTFGFKGIEREDGAKIGHGYFDKVTGLPRPCPVKCILYSLHAGY